MSISRITLLALLLSITAVQTRAQTSWETSGGLTLVHIDAANSQVENDQTMSVDLFITREDTAGSFFLYIEGNSSLSADNVSTVFSESNADAGSALDVDRKGRVQISEFNYRFDNAFSGRMTLGLLDASAYLDRSRITNDENIQFLGASFVNNPTIEFPDYTLGVAWEKPSTGMAPGINVVLASSQGLADNPNLSYSQLVQLTDDNDGLFAALGAGWEAENTLFRIGAWVNTQPHDALLDPDSSGHNNMGLYTVMGGSWDEHALSLRAGMARQSVSEGEKFLSLAYRFLWHDFALGVGLARTFLSADAQAPGKGDNSQYEIYARRSVNESLHFTASLQKIDNSGFTSYVGSELDSATLAGLRFHFSF